MPRYIFQIFLLLLTYTISTAESHSCTSAIIGADATPYGRPLLWKHRDTNTIDNKVEYIPSANGEFSYVALFNADDINCEQAWIGMNEAGFAVMNTASYNIKNDNVPQHKMDKEGYLMTIALRTCRTIDDFANLLEKLPRPMGVEANFGAIDAEGNGAYFETNNDSYVKYDIKDAPGNVIIRTNYSHSGREKEGYGHIREANAQHLLKPYIETKSVTAEVLTEQLSRSFYHDIFKKDFSSDHWVIDQDFIPRYKSTATIVVEGIIPLGNATDITSEIVSNQYIMWVGMGYPPCSEILPVWCEAGGVPDCLKGLEENGHSEMSNRVKARRDEVFQSVGGNSDKYIDMTKLFNSDGTGYIQTLTPLNLETYRVARRIRDGYVKKNNPK